MCGACILFTQLIRPSHYKKNPGIVFENYKNIYAHDRCSYTIIELLIDPRGILRGFDKILLLHGNAQPVIYMCICVPITISIYNRFQFLKILLSKYVFPLRRRKSKDSTRDINSQRPLGYNLVC